MIRCQTSSVNHCWLFLNQYQRDAEPELLNGPNGTDSSVENSVR